MANGDGTGNGKKRWRKIEIAHEARNKSDALAANLGIICYPQDKNIQKSRQQRQQQNRQQLQQQQQQLKHEITRTNMQAHCRTTTIGAFPILWAVRTANAAMQSKTEATAGAATRQ